MTGFLVLPPCQEKEPAPYQLPSLVPPFFKKQKEIADAAKYDPGSLVITFSSSVAPDMNDDITLNTQLYELAVGGVGTGESWKIPGRAPVTGSYPVIYPFLDAGTGQDSLGPAFVIYQGDHAGATDEMTVTLTPEVSRWLFNENLDPSKVVGSVKQDTDVNENGAWETPYAGGYEVLEYTPEKLVIKLTNLNKLEGSHLRLQLVNNAGIPTVLDDQNYGLTMTTNINGTESKNMYAWTKLLSANANADAAKSAPTASFVAYGNDTAATGKTADGQDSNANSAAGIATLNKTITNTLVAVNTNKVIEENLILVNADTGEELKRFDNVKPGEKVSFNVEDIALKVGANSFNYKLIAENSRNPELKIELTDPVNATLYEKQVAGIDVENTINGEDADTADKAVTVVPGTQKVEGTLTNKGTYTLTPANTTLKYEVQVGEAGSSTVEVIELPADFSVKPGETIDLSTLDLVVEKQGSTVGKLFASTSYTNKLPAVLGGDQVTEASDEDDVYAKALTSEIDLVDDSYETELGHDLEFDIIGNDTSSDEAHPVDPSTIKILTSSKGVISEDGKTVTNEGQWTVTIGEDGKGKVTWAEGATDKELPVLTYTATNDLGDVTEDAFITLVGFENKVELETYLIDENGERIDADTPDEAVKYTSTGVKQSVAVITNTGDKPLVNPELGYYDEAGEWVTVAVLEGVTIEPGQTHEHVMDTVDLVEGQWSTDLTVRANGAEDSDAINAIVELPAPEPTPEEEVTPKKDLEEKPQNSESKDTNTASNLFERASGGNGLIASLAALAAAGLAAGVAFRGRLASAFKRD